MRNYSASDHLRTVEGKLVVWLGFGKALEPGEAKQGAADAAAAQKGRGPIAALDPAEKAAAQNSALPPARPRPPAGPGNPMLPAEDGSLISDARFEDARDLERGGAVWMLARAVGFEGSQLELVLEREDESGRWIHVGQAVATVRSGAVRAAVTCDASGKELKPIRPDAAIKPAPKLEGVLSHARFENLADLERAGPVWIAARAAGLEGRCVQLVLEREANPGEWVAMGQSTATVRSGIVRAAINHDPRG